MSRDDDPRDHDHDDKITRGDIESKFRELQGDVAQTAEQAKSYAIAAAAVVLVGIAAIAFVMGRRKGRKKSTVVEIRRI
ncbi:MAG: hypothetical protein H0W25_00880 [Acidimicrobiia bacterium]|nr:hypothetical protein [Acidimicrobiia bacterium]